ncbi:MAG: ATP-binding protein, partial [Hymenobacter sp.]
DVTMAPRRVNIIIGEPNVGKSNILEAMSLLGGMQYDKKRRFMDGIVRFKSADQLFFDNIIANIIQIETDKAFCFLTPSLNDTVDWFEAVMLPRQTFEKLVNPDKKIPDFHKLISSNDVWFRLYEAAYKKQKWEDFRKKLIELGGIHVNFKKTGLRLEGEVLRKKLNKKNLSTVIARPYFFAKNQLVGEEYNRKYLEPPHGENLKTVIQAHTSLRKEIAKLFSRSGLRLSLRMETKQLEVIKDLDGIVYTYPYSSIADTLQRLIFYLAAIESNDDAVLLFEEPEAHSYPVYVSHLAQRIVESRNNQFFVVTHSPYFITEVLEEMLTSDELKPELAIFVAYYEEYQTKVRQLSDEEVYNIRRDGLDVFYNMARFVPQR